MAAIRRGEVGELERLLAENVDLATVRLGDDGPGGMSRSLLHVATDWPGHFPRVADSIGVLVEAGAEVDARFHGPHEETPLHWAASSDDLAALDALLDRGAEIDATGAVIAGGTPLDDARAFRNWAAARRLVERGALMGLQDAAALGMVDRLEARLESSQPSAEELNATFWSACHGGQQATAELLLAAGAELDWIPGWERTTPLDAAARSGAHQLLTALHARGASTAADLCGD